MVKMQVATDILKVLFFPGLLFMALCGGLLAFLEGLFKAVFYGGKGPEWRLSLGKITEGAAYSLGEIIIMVVSLASLGMAGYLLVWAKGDLFTLILLLAAAELLPMILRAGVAGDMAYTPLVFRTASARLIALFSVGACVSLRFPVEYAAGLQTFKGEGAFNALQLWSGTGYALILAALIAAALALFIFNLGRPPWAYIPEEAGQGTIKEVYLRGAQGAERAVTMLLSIILFLGYPWEGGMGILTWSAAALGSAAVLTAARAWAEGRDRATLRRWQEVGFVLAVLALIVALAAVW
jgi:hypothetical protein